MLTWFIALIVIGAFIGLITGGSEGAKGGAIMGGITFFGILIYFVIPFVLMLLVMKSC